MKVREKFGQAFAEWGRFVVRRTWLVLVSALAVTAYPITWLPQLTVDNSTESFLRPSDPARKHYDALREQFGQDERIIITVEGPAVFDLDYLGRLRDLHGDIEAEVPYLLEVTSLLNARNTRGEADRLVVEDLMAEWPETDADLQRLAARVRETPLYENTLITGAATVSTLAIKPLIYSTLAEESDVLAGFDDALGDEGVPAPAPEFLTGAERIELHAALSAVTDRHRADDFRLALAGGGVMNIHATKMMMRDIKVFMSACVRMAQAGAIAGGRDLDKAV